MSVRIAAAAISLCCVVALAHGTAVGLQGTFNAFLFSVLEPPAPVALFAIGLLMGSHGARFVELAFLIFLCSLLTGLAVTRLAGIVVFPEVPLSTAALVASLLVVFDARTRIGWIFCLCAITGFFMGILTAPARASIGTTSVLMASVILGAGSAVSMVALSVAFIASRWESAFVTTAIRVLASWIAAIVLFYLSLFLRQRML